MIFPHSFNVILTLLALATVVSARPSRLPADVVQAMNNPSAITLYSVHPDSRAAHWFSHKLHGYRVLGKTSIADTKERRQVSSTIKRAIRDHAGGDAKCIFSPRHAVRFSRGEQTYDFVICYECRQLVVYRDEQSVFSQSIAGSSDVLDDILRRARVRIAK
jgi:hypothetical protein